MSLNKYFTFIKDEDQLDKTDDRSIEDAFRDGWENGWDSHRAKAQTSGNISVCYSADEFDPDWEASKTKKKMEER